MLHSRCHALFLSSSLVSYLDYAVQLGHENCRQSAIVTISHRCVSHRCVSCRRVVFSKVYSPALLYIPDTHVALQAWGAAVTADIDVHS